MVPSLEPRIVKMVPDARIVPFGEKAIVETLLECPLNCYSYIPRSASHSLMVLSLEPTVRISNTRS